MSLLDIGNVTHSYGTHCVLDDVSIEINRGELIGLIGPNGAGKSTLLTVIAGLVNCSGRVCYQGRSIRRISLGERADLISYLPQGRDIAWSVKVETLVEIGRKRQVYSARLPSDRRCVEHAMQRMDILDLRQRSVTTLSGGELARVLLARVLAQDTPIILADEPISGLDPAHQIGVMEVLDGLAKEGRTIVVSMHDLSLAARWCKRLILLNKGKVISDGPPQSVLTRDRLADVYGVTAHISDGPDGMIVLPITKL